MKNGSICLRYDANKWLVRGTELIRINENNLAPAVPQTKSRIGYDIVNYDQLVNWKKILKATEPTGCGCLARPRAWGRGGG